MTVNIYELLQTWNNAGVTFDAISMNVTDTASQADSRLLDLLTGGVRQFYVQKDGEVGITGDLLVDVVRSANATDFNLYSDTTSLARFGTAETYLADALILSDDPVNQSILAAIYGSANTLDIRNGTNAQTLSLYGTYSGGGSNYERLTFDFDAGVPVIDTAALGTGVARDLRLSRAGATRLQVGVSSVDTYVDFLPDTDLSRALGGASNRWTSVFAAVLDVSGQSLTGSQADAALDIATTWNTTGTPSAILLNVTDTASNAASNLLDLQVGGVTQFDVDKGGDVLALGEIRSDTEFNLNGDVRLQRDGANILALRNSTTAQTLNLYNTSNGANYERIGIYFSGNDAFVETNQGGTGVARDLYIRRGASGGLQFANGIIYHFDDLLPGADNTYDLGASGSSYVDLWMDGSIVFADRADHSQTPAVGLHQLWVRTSDNALIFTDEAGTDTNLLAGGGGGDLWTDPVDGNITWSVTDTYDIGTSASRPNKVYSTAFYSDNYYGLNGSSDGHLIMSAAGIRLRENTNDLAFVTTDRLSVGSTSRISWTSGTGDADGTEDLFLYRDAANILAQRNSTNAQQFRVYNTDDGTQTNTEYGALNWNTNVLQMGTFATGTGVSRELEIVRDGTVMLRTTDQNTLEFQGGGSNAVFQPQSDNNRALGSSGRRWQELWLGAGGMIMHESADHQETPTAGRHQLWVRSTDAKLMFTDDAGTDLTLAPGGSTGAIQYNNAGAWAASLLSQGTNTIEQINGVNAQTFNIYNTDDGGTNYERGYVRWSVDNNLEIGTEAGGTGSNRGLRIESFGGTKIYVGSPTNVYADLTAGTDDTEELGEVARRWGQAHISKGITLGDVTDHTETPTTGLHQLWVRTSDNKPIFTDEAGTDYDLTAGGAGGDLWSDPVDADILPTGNDNIFDVGSSSARFAEGWFVNTFTDRIYGDGGTTDTNIQFGATDITFRDDNTSTTLSLTPTDLVVTSAHDIAWSSTAEATGTPDVILARDAANILAQRNSTNAQEFRVYNTDDGTQTNTEYAEYRWAGNSFFMGTAASGTGLDRTYYLTYGGGNRIRISGNIEFYANCQPRVGSNINLGSAGNEWDSIWTKEGLVFVDIADHPETPTTGVHQLWVRTSDNSLIFTDEAGTDTDLLAAGAGGDLWSDPIDSSMTVDTDSTYNLGTDAARLLNLYTDLAFVNFEMQFGQTTQDITLQRQTAQMLAIHDDTNPMRVKVYNTTDATFTNTEYADIGWISDELYIGTAKDGTGSARNFSLRRNGSNVLRFGNSSTTTYNSILPSGSNKDLGQMLGTHYRNIAGDEISMAEKADHTNSPTAGQGLLWVKNDTPNSLIFTDDAGTDHDLTAGATAGTNSYWIPAGAMFSRVTNGAAWGSDELATNDIQRGYWAFDASTEEGVQFSFAMPEGWDEGTITAKFVWSHPSTATNFGVVWDISGVAFSDGDAMDAARGTVQTATDTGGTTNDHYISPETSAVTIGGTPAEGDTVWYEVTRVAANGSDTLAVDAYLLGVRLYFTRDSLTD